MKRVCMLIAAVVLVSALYYAFTQQWEDAGESVYYGGLIFAMAFIAEKEHEIRKQRKLRRARL